jgi:hypothetical protein
MTAEKVLENLLRRVAVRRGYKLVKSRRRDPNAIDFGGYMVVDARTNAVLFGGSPTPFVASLDDVKDFFDEDAEARQSSREIRRRGESGKASAKSRRPMRR